ncbi:unnamed protein product, partial [Sphagnum jensenii]
DILPLTPSWLAPIHLNALHQSLSAPVNVERSLRHIMNPWFFHHPSTSTPHIDSYFELHYYSAKSL